MQIVPSAYMQLQEERRNKAKVSGTGKPEEEHWFTTTWVLLVL